MLNVSASLMKAISYEMSGRYYKVLGLVIAKYVEPSVHFDNLVLCLLVY
jgi:hypothetical protein